MDDGNVKETTKNDEEIDLNLSEVNEAKPAAKKICLGNIFAETEEAEQEYEQEDRDSFMPTDSERDDSFCEIKEDNKQKEEEDVDDDKHVNFGKEEEQDENIVDPSQRNQID